MEKYTLAIEKRKLFGKQLRKLRRENIVPANIFGKGIDSISVQSKLLDLQKVFKKAKNTQLVYLKLDKDEYPVLIQALQKDPVSNAILHADFRKVNLKEKVETLVPVEITGELPVVKNGEADVLILTHEITVECLPTDIPEKIIISITELSGIGAEIKVKDLPKKTTYVYVDDPEKDIVQIVAAQKEEIPVPVAPVAEEVAITEEGAPVAPTAPAEGGTPGAKEDKGGKQKTEEKKK